MKRRLASLLATTLAAATLAVLAPASPAHADTNVCTGQGVANTGPLVYPVTTLPLGTVTVTQPRVVGFAFNVAFGTCAPDLGKGLTATGIINGWCGHSSGQGVTGNGHRFTWIEAGSIALVTGEVTGVAHIIPDPTIAGNSCLTGATSFLVTFAIVLSHCTISKFKTTITIPFPATLTPFTQFASVHTGPMTYFTKICF